MILRAVAILALLFTVLAPAPAMAADPPTKTPIEHFMFLLQENHSFDNYFGTYPGADGIPAKTCMPIDPTNLSLGCVAPFPLGGKPITDLLHNRVTFVDQYRDGTMDGFISAHVAEGGVNALDRASSTMGYYNADNIPFYWNVADKYVLFDRFFSSAAAGSFMNHMYWISAGPGDPNHDSFPPNGFDNILTIFDRLQAAGISWKFYCQNYDPSITYRTVATAGDKAAQVVFSPLLTFNNYIDNPALMSHIVDIEQYYTDLNNGTLPAVAFMAPLGSSEHPPGSLRAGQSFVQTIVDSLMRSDYWRNSAFMWAYDDWGGWYDHVLPPKVDAYGYGFRVPALLVSAYARVGQINNTTLDYTSGMKFIEDNWGLQPLTTRDAAAQSIVSAFDFTSPPREPSFLTASRETNVLQEPNRPILYAAYAAAIVLAVGLLLVAGLPPLIMGALALRRRRSQP